MGQAPTRVWYNRYSILRSGRPLRRQGSLCFAHRRTAVPQSSGISDNKLSRARTSSLLFVSWVDEASIERGHWVCLSAQVLWNSSGDKLKCPGSPPTSFNDTNRLKQYKAVSSTPFAITGLVTC